MKYLFLLLAACARQPPTPMAKRACWGSLGGAGGYVVCTQRYPQGYGSINLDGCIWHQGHEMWNIGVLQNATNVYARRCE